jgi:hypothetical protein
MRDVAGIIQGPGESPKCRAFLGKATDIVQMGHLMLAGTFGSGSSSRKRSLLLHPNVRIRRVFTVTLKCAHFLRRQIREQVIPPERFGCRRDVCEHAQGLDFGVRGAF